MKWRDTRTGYGWISIGLHWSTAILIAAIWVIGSGVPGAEGAAADRRLQLHTTVALGAYALLWGRILWRLRGGHPGPLPAQGRISHRIGAIVHFVILGAVAVLLVSGPLMAWAGGLPIGFFGWTSPRSAPQHPALFHLMQTFHHAAALAIVTGTMLHIAGVLRNVAFTRDGTLDKMLIAAGAESGASPTGASPTPNGIGDAPADA